MRRLPLFVSMMISHLLGSVECRAQSATAETLSPPILPANTPVILLPGHRLFIFLACFVAMCFGAGHAFAQESTSPTPWHVKGGLLEVSRESIVFERKKHDPIPIKTVSVTSVCYDTSSHARGPSAWEATKDMGSSDPHGLIFAPLVLPVVAGIHASKATRHLVTVHWRPEQPGE
jgi:hypothetical protein